MKLSIRDFRRIQRADIDVPNGQIALIGARNGEGKTSLYTAAQLAFTAKKMPGKFPATLAHKLVRYDTPCATVSAAMGDTAREMLWTQSTVEIKGLPDSSMSAVPAGMTVIGEMEPKERAAFFLELLKAEPTKDHWTEKLSEIFDQAKTTDIVETILSLGPDAAQKELKTDREVEVRRFKEVTQQQWGKKQSENWRHPQATELHLNDWTEKDLNAKVVQARLDLESAIKNEGAGEAQIAIAKTEAEKAGEYQTTMNKLEQQCKDKVAELQASKVELDKVSVALQGFSKPCPGCGCGLEIGKGQTIVASEKPPFDLETVTPLSEKYDELTETVTKLDKERFNLEVDFQNAKLAHKKSEESAKEYARLMSKGKKESSEKKIQELRDLIVLHEQRLKAIQQQNLAHELDVKIRQYDKADEVLQPTGLRQQMLESKLAALKTKTLDPLCKKVGWPSIRIAPDLTILGKRIDDDHETEYYWLCESEQIRVNVVLAMAVAKIKGENCILLDCLERLEPENQEKLLTLLATVKMGAVICIMLGNKAKLVDVSKRGAGKSYWLSNGILEEIGGN